MPYSLAPQRQVPEKISRLSFIFAIIGLGVLVPSLLYCAYIVDSAVHSDHPEAVALYGSSRLLCTWAFFCPSILLV